MSRETMDNIVFVVLSLMVFVLAFLLLETEKKNRELKVELKRVNLDKAGLNGLCGALIDQKYKKNYNSLDYEVNLPDGMTVAIKVNYFKDYTFSPVQELQLMRIHKEAIAEITHEEWNKHGEWK